MPVLTTTEKAGYDASVVKTNTLSGTNTGDQDISLMVESDITGLTGATQVNNYVVISQAGYDAIVTKDPNTVYDVY